MSPTSNPAGNGGAEVGYTDDVTVHDDFAIHDALPAPVRAWYHTALFLWSAKDARDFLRRTDIPTTLTRLEFQEAALRDADAREAYGPNYPLLPPLNPNPRPGAATRKARCKHVRR